MTELEQLAQKIRDLSPPDKLRLAAGLLEGKRPELAHQIANDVVIELGAALALAAIKPDAKRKDRDAQ